MSDKTAGVPLTGVRWVFALCAVLAVALLVPALDRFAWLFALGLLALAGVIVVQLFRASRAR